MPDTGDSEVVPEGVDLERPNAARIYDWALGGTANWAIDREFGERAMAKFPLVRNLARTNRDFLGRAVRYAAQSGVTQFLDIGSGVPTVGNVHEVADQINQRTRCVYVDNEQVAVAHAQVLLERNADTRRHAAVNADMRDVDRVWDAAMETGVLNPQQPIAVIMVAMLHFIPHGGHEAVSGYRKLLAPGSQLIISHVTESGVPQDELDLLRPLTGQYDQSSTPARVRTYDEIKAFYGNFEMVEPGLVPLPQWQPDTAVPDLATHLVPGKPMTCVLGGIGQKP